MADMTHKTSGLVGHRLDDYVTEKVYNGLQAGTLPVYWGATNIQDYVPRGSVVQV